MQTVGVDMGVFIRKATALLETGIPAQEGYATVNINGYSLIFKREHLDSVLRIIYHLFYRCYGGWKLEIEVQPDGICTGRVSFVTYA